MRDCDEELVDVGWMRTMMIVRKSFDGLCGSVCATDPATVSLPLPLKNVTFGYTTVGPLGLLRQCLYVILGKYIEKCTLSTCVGFIP